MLNISFTENLNQSHYLTMASDKIRRFSTARPAMISISNIFSPERKRVEKFIEDIYFEKYGAIINSHYPILMSIRDEDDNIIAAVGFRYANTEELFLEQYLDESVENILSKKFKNKELNRHEIVEVGSLASNGNGASIFLFMALATYLKKHNKEYVVVTATSFLRGYFNKLGLEPKYIADACNSALEDNGKSWGTYYATEPKVIAGTLSSACKLLKKNLSVELKDNEDKYFAQIHTKIQDYII